MARLIPEFIEPYLKKLLIATPKPLRYVACYAYWKLLRVHYLIQVWNRYGRHYDAPLKPFRIIEVDPMKINYYSNVGGNRLYPVIKEGNWDDHCAHFTNGSVYTTFYDRFVKNKSWSKTDRYHDYIEKYGSEEEVLKKSDKLTGASNQLEENINPMEDAFRKYDQIFADLENGEYKLQKEIISTEDRIENPGLYSSMVPELGEITVDIGKNGTMMCYSGQHRLAMAKILELDSVPVRIRTRHEQWQQKRDAVWRGEEPPEDHPDLQPPN